ncbi:nucleotidyltransferase domain-containing protein [bacterium]|nr:nucleotidyltransferase domain-containing protein [bacterium]
MRRVRIEIPQTDLEAFCHKWKVVALALFGSVLRDDFGPESDVDVLVDFVEGAGWSLFDLMEMRQELCTLLSRPVDLVESVAIRNPYRRRAIMENRAIIYGR